MTIVSGLQRIVSPQLVLGGLIALGGLSGCRYLPKCNLFNRSADGYSADEEDDGTLGDPQTQQFQPASPESSDFFNGNSDRLYPIPSRAPGLREPAPLPPAPSTEPGPNLPPMGKPTDGTRAPAAAKDAQASRLKLTRERFTAIITGQKSRPHAQQQPRKPAPPAEDNTTDELEEPAPQPEKSRSARVLEKVASLHRFHSDRKVAASTVSRQVASDFQPVRLSSPPEIFDFADGQERGTPSPRLAVEESRSGLRRSRSDAYPSDTPQFSQPLPRTASTTDRPLDLTPAADRRQAATADSGAGFSRESRSPISTEATPSLPSNVSEPSRLPSPPVLESAPAPAEARSGNTNLSIGHVAICREVRGFGDLTPFDPRSLSAGQQILIYASLANFQSLPTPGGYRTMTISSLEVRSRSGQLIARQPLGTAVDLAQQRRRDYFLTHPVTIPESLPSGDYIFCLSVYDLLSQQTSCSQVGVQIMADRSRRDETDGSAGFAVRPASSRR